MVGGLHPNKNMKTLGYIFVIIAPLHAIGCIIGKTPEKIMFSVGFAVVGGILIAKFKNKKTAK